jgi:hypothetical protein
MIGTALGGPLGGAAAAMLASKLGIKESTVTAVSEVLSSGKMNAEQIAGIKLAEIDFERFLEANKIKLEELDTADRASARAMHIAIGGWVPGVLALVVVGGFFGVLLGMMFGLLKVSDQQSLLILLGALSAGFGAVLNFYYGSSHGSRANQQAVLDKAAGK